MHHSRSISFSTVLALSLCALLAGIQGPVLQAQTGGTRSHDWVQTSDADWQTGQLAGLEIAAVDDGALRLAPGATTGTYTSIVVTAHFPFTAIAPHWRADVPQETTIRVELRVQDDRGWSDWHPFEESEWVTAREQFFPELPLLTWNARQFQYRVTMATETPGSSPVLEAMTITTIDTSDGPSTSEAKRAAVPGPIGAQAVAQPAIISRAGWGADEGLMTWTPEYQDTEKMVIHHTVTPNDYTEDQGAYWVRAIYEYHAATLGWGDIGYNYLVDKYGNIYEGRFGGPDVVGGHVYGYNYGSTGISVIGTHGNYTGSVAPTAASLTSLADLSAWEANRSYIHPLESAFFKDIVTQNLAGHRDYGSSSCPGDLLYAELPGLRASAWDRIVAANDEYDVDWLSWDAITATLQTSQTYAIDVEVRNSGWFTWSQAGPPNSVRLGYHWYDKDGQRIVQPQGADHRGPLPHDVTFGHTFTFDPALVTTPVSPGTYTLEWDMVHEGVTWFHDDNPSSPVLTVTVVVTNYLGLTSGSQVVLEDAGVVTVALQLGAPSPVAVTVPFSVSGSATQQEDYVAPASPVVISAGDTSADIAIAVNDDGLDEGDETVVVSLGTPTGAALGATFVHTITIVDDDVLPVAGFASASQSEPEIVDTVTATIHLDRAYALTVTVPFTASGTAIEGVLADYTVTPSPVVIPPGQTSGDILIAVNDDGLDEEDETIVLSLGTPTSAALGATTVHTVTVLDPLAMTGYVFDLYGHPVSGGQVGAQVGITATADVSGAYALYLPPYGTYTVTARAFKYTPGLPVYSVDGTQDNLTYSFVLAPDNVVNTFGDGQMEGDLSGLKRGGVSASPPARTSTAHTGVGAAEMTVASPGARTWLSQSVTLPSEPISPTLSLFYDVLSVGNKSRLQVTLAATSTVTYTLPLTVSGWSHYTISLPEMSGDVDVTFELVQSTAITPTTVLVDEVIVGYEREPYKVFLPLVIKSYGQN